MGVDIGSLFRVEKISFNDLQNRVIVIDAYNVLHQFLASIRQRDGTPLKDSQGRITSHLSGLFYRTANMVDAGIKPIYVFDGKPHPLKAKTLELRENRKIEAEKAWKEALEKGDLETAKTKAQQTSRVTDEIIDQSKKLLTALGIPVIQAPSEGEAQASYMVKKGDFQKTISSIGYLEPVTSKDLYFPITGTIDAVYTEEGAHVRKGDILAHIEDKEYRLDYLVAKNAYDQVRINGSEKDMEEKKLKLEVAKDNLDATTLLSPFSGLITDIYIETADHASLNTKIMHIIDDTSYKIKVEVNETDIRFVKIGQEVRITMDAFPSKEFSGKVTEISYESKNDSGVVIVPVTVELLDKYKAFKSGLSANVDIIIQLEKDKIIVPQTAIINMGKRNIVLKIKDGTPQAQSVKVKATNGIYALIGKGLIEGDKIIVNVSKFKESFSSQSDKIISKNGQAPNKNPNTNFRLMKKYR